MNAPAPSEAAAPLPSRLVTGWARWWPALAVVALLLIVAALALAWTTQRRVMALEQELVRRQADSQTQAAEARVVARAAHGSSR